MRRLSLLGIGLIFPIAMFAQSVFDAGAIPTSSQDVHITDSPITIEEITAPTGGDGNYTYKWVRLGGMENKDSITTSGTFSVPTSWLDEGTTITITRYVKSGTDDWTISSGSCALYTFPQFDAGTIDEGPDTFSCPAPSLSQNVTVTSTKAASGDNLISYIWKLDGAIISGATDENYSTSFDVPGTYKLSRWAKDGSITDYQQSGELTVVILPKIEVGAITAQTQPDSISFETLPYNLTITSVTDATGGDGNIQYQWQIDDVVVPDATDASFSYSFTTEGTFVISRWVKDRFAPFAKTGEYVVTILPEFNHGTLATQAQPDTISWEALPYNPNIASATEATGGDGSVQYQWTINDSIVADATEASFTPTINQPEGSSWTRIVVSRWAKDRHLADFQKSGEYIIDITPIFNPGTIKSQTQPDTISWEALPYSPSIASATEATGGNGNIQYQWRTNDIVVAGAAEASFTPTINQPEGNSWTRIVVSRWAKDGLLADFQKSGEYIIDITPKFNPGTIKAQTQPDTVNFEKLPKAFPITSTTNATGGSGKILYKWEINGTVIDTATIASYTPTIAKTTDNNGKTFAISRWAKDELLSDYVKSGEYVIQILDSINAGAITAQEKPDTICFEELPKNIVINSVANATGGNGNIQYQWKINDIVVDTALTASYNFVLAKTAENSGKSFIITRWAKDAISTDYKKSGEYKIDILKEFSAGEITSKTDTVCATELPKRIEILSVQDATGGDGNIQYRWTLGAPDGDPGKGEVLPVTSAMLDTTIAKAGTYIFYRWAKDGVAQTEWKASANNYAVTIYEPFDAGTLPLIYDTLCYTNTESFYDITLGSLADAAGGNTKIDYQWTMRCDWKKAVVVKTSDTTQITIYVDTTATAVINNAKSIETYRFEKGNVKNARFPMTFTFYRYAKDSRCNTEWQAATDSIKYVMSDHQEQTGTVYICECNFPYTYTYTYLDKHTEDIVFTNDGEQHIMPDLTPYGCNKPVTLTGVKCLIPEATVNDIASTCETASSLSFKYTVTKGAPSRYKLEFDDNAKSYGFADVPFTALPKNGIISIPKPASAKAGVYSVKVYFTDTRPKEYCTSQAYTLTFTLTIDSYVHTKWTDVIFVDNSDDNTGVKFSAYQWYRNGNPIEGATGQYYYQEGGLDGTYYVVLTTTDGKSFISCEKKIVPKTAAPARSINTYPVPANTNTPITVELSFATEELEGGVLEVYNAVGRLITRYDKLNTIMEIQTIVQKGIYILKFTTSEGKAHTAKFMVK